MCQQLHKKKYMYLSMCSYCNIVSKYPIAVKKHIKTKHSNVTFKYGLKVDIPIRVEERYAKSIRKSLDRKRFLKDKRAQSLFPAEEKRGQSLFPAENKRAQSLFPAKEKRSPSLFLAEDKRAQSLIPAEDERAQSLFQAQEEGAQSLFPAKDKRAQSLFPAEEKRGQSLFPTKAKRAQGLFPVIDKGTQNLFPTKNKRTKGLFPVNDNKTQQSVLQNNDRRIQGLFPTKGKRSLVLFPTKDKRTRCVFPTKINLFPKYKSVAVKNEITETVASNENTPKQGSISCAVCKENFKSLISFLKHLSAKDHQNKNIYFKCSECFSICNNVKELVDHINRHREIKQSDSIDKAESQSNTLQCPYCVSLYQETEQLYLHIEEKHATDVEVMKIEVKPDRKHGGELNHTRLLFFQCRYCDEQFHSVGSFLQHIAQLHPSHNMQTVRSARKRNLPKWLQEDCYELKAKRNKGKETDHVTVKHDRDKNIDKPTVGKGSSKRLPNERRAILVKLPGTKEGSCRDGVQTPENGNYRKFTIKDEVTWSKVPEHIDHDYLRKTDVSVNSDEQVIKTEIHQDIEKTETVIAGERSEENTSDSATLDDEEGETGSFEEDSEGDSEDDILGQEQESEESDEEVQTSPGTDMYKCELCESIQFKHWKSLTRHFRMKHPGMSMPCKKKIKYHNRKDGSDGEKVKMNYCPHCDTAEYVHIKSLRRHIRIKHPGCCLPETEKNKNLSNKTPSKKLKYHNRKDGPDYEKVKLNCCPYCDTAEYEHIKSLRRHIRIKHPGCHLPETETNKNLSNKTPSKKLEKGATDSDTEGSASVGKYKCPFCAFYLHHREYIFSHVKKAHPEVEHFTSGDIIKETVSLTRSDINWECFKCPECGFSSTWKILLLRHYKVHHASEPPLKNIPCILPKSLVGKDESSQICLKDVEGNEAFQASSSEYFDKKDGTFLPEPEIVDKQCRKMNSFLCPYCNLVCVRKHSTKLHINAHVDGDIDNIPIVKCVVVKPASERTYKINTISTEHAEISSVQNGNTNISIEDLEIDKEKVSNANDVPFCNLSLKNGTYICPLCDNYRTFVKYEAVEHMEVNHKSSLPEVELIYIIEAILDSKEKGRDNAISLRCASCNLSSGSVTEMLRHTLTHVSQTEGRMDFDSEADITGLEGTCVNQHTDQISKDKKAMALFEIVSLPCTGKEVPDTDIEQSDEVYKCWLCDPVCVFKTKRGGKKHMMKQHKDQIYTDVTEVLNQMINAVDVRPLKCYVCAQCKTQIGYAAADLVTHFKEMHPDKVTDLDDQMNNARKRKGMADCEICHVRCPDIQSLPKHLLLHKNKFKIHCPTCWISFENNEEMVSHCSRAHSKSSHMCNVCGKIYLGSKEFKRHMRDHEDNSDDKRDRILCQHCGMNTLKSGFKRHLLRFHAMHINCRCEICMTQISPAGSSFEICKLCYAMFCSKFMLKAHCIKEHGKGKGQKLLQCRHCGLSFENSLQQHGHKCKETKTCTSEGHSASTCLISDQIELLDGSRDAGEKITADITSAEIDSEILQYNVSSELPYTCRICQKSFRIKKYLYCHVRRKHADDETKKFQCTYCKMRFPGKSALKTHYKTHIGVRPHVCKICRSSYKTASTLKVHMRLHCDKLLPQFSCRYCGCKFVHNNALMAHVSTHSKIKPFTCPFCQQGFNFSSDLKRHMNRYIDDKSIVKDGSTCIICKEQFPNDHYLSKHFNTHFPKEPFHCNVCQRKFISFRQLYVHKSKNDHFTEFEINEAKAHMRKSGRKINKIHERQEIYMKRKFNRGKGREISVDSPVLDQELDDQGQQSAKHIVDDQSCVKTEIPNDVEENNEDQSKIAMSFVESSAIENILKIEKTDEKEAVETRSQQYQHEYIVKDLSEFQVHPAVPDVTLEGTGHGDIFGIQDALSESETVHLDVSELAHVEAENVRSQQTDQTHIYQTTDGSFIFLVNPKKR